MLKRNTVYISVLIVLSLLLWLPRLRGPLDLRYDAGVYYILGTSLAEGKGYRLLNEPGEIQAIQYPPLLPLFAAAHQRLVGTSHPAVAGHLLRISYLAIFVALTVAVYRLSKYYLVPGLAFLATVTTLLHLHTTWMSEIFFAELPFALTSVLFLLVSRRAKQRSREWLAGLLAVACVLLRSSGIAVLGAWVGESAVKRRFREMAVRATIALIPVVAWQSYVTHVKHSAEYAQPAYPYQRAGYQYYNVGYLDNLAYVDPFAPERGAGSISMLLERISSNVTIMPRSLGAAVSVMPSWASYWHRVISRRLGVDWLPSFFADVLPFLVLGTLVICGLVLLAIRREWLITVYVVGSCGLICLTPWPGQFERYLWPLTPLLVIAFLSSLVAIRNRISISGRTSLRMAAGAVIGIVVAGVVTTEAAALRKAYLLNDTTLYKDENSKQREYRLLFYESDWQLHDEAVDWLDGHAYPNAIVGTSTPHWVYLKTGLQSVMPPFEPDVAEAQRLLDSVPVSYLIVDNLSFVDVSRRYAAPVVDSFPERWELVYSSAEKGSRIYRRRTHGKETAVGN